VARAQKRFGLLVDGVREILELDDDNIVTEAAPGIKSEFVLGIAKIQENLLVLLDIFRVLSAPAEATIWVD
jgi:chemotaxis signal transduction protein